MVYLQISWWNDEGDAASLSSFAFLAALCEIQFLPPRSSLLRHVLSGKENKDLAGQFFINRHPLELRVMEDV